MGWKRESCDGCGGTSDVVGGPFSPLFFSSKSCFNHLTSVSKSRFLVSKNRSRSAMSWAEASSACSFCFFLARNLADASVFLRRFSSSSRHADDLLDSVVVSFDMEGGDAEGHADVLSDGGVSFAEAIESAFLFLEVLFEGSLTELDEETRVEEVEVCKFESAGSGKRVSRGTGD